MIRSKPRKGSTGDDLPVLMIDRSREFEMKTYIVTLKDSKGNIKAKQEYQAATMVSARKQFCNYLKNSNIVNKPHDTISSHIITY